MAHLRALRVFRDVPLSTRMLIFAAVMQFGVLKGKCRRKLAKTSNVPLPETPDYKQFT